MKRVEDGIVVITNPERCTNCQLCVEACPYDAPKMGTGGKVNIMKCNLCLDRLSESKAPVCVTTCPTEAIDVGMMEELIAKHGEMREVEGFADYRRTNPSVIFRNVTEFKIVRTSSNFGRYTKKGYCQT
jgi:anaerobic dimethyl sulfoxide reductase subunit B (iron-sulfur subunit)